MNSKPDFTNNSWKDFNWLWAALALSLIVPARAGTQPAAIPFSDIGARATANYQGEALGATATADGARLRCGFQKLEGQATTEGLWLESTKPGGAGRLRLVAVAVGRGAGRARQCALTEAASSVRSGMSIVTVPQGDQAPLGAPCTHGAASFFDMPLLTELQTTFSDVSFYIHAAPNGAIACLRQGAQTLARTGKVSAEDKLVRFTRPGVTEEYSVSVDGVRQDFVIAAPPAGTGDLRVELALSGARAEAAAGGARLRLEGSERALTYSRLRVADATGRELRARLEVLSADRLAVSVADASATYPVRIDPTFSDADWVSLNPGMPGANNTVRVIAVDGNGNVYVGGDFTFIGTVPANHIAKWDGSAWSALGSGMNGIVWALAVSGTNLYAGGLSISKWDGGAWSALASLMSGGVYALAVSGTNLYAGGSFGTVGGVPANRIAKWDGSAWSALGSGMSGSVPQVSALAVSGTDLYAGGNFTTAGGMPATNIAKWDGSAWSALGSGMNGDVVALAVSGTDLYAGGWFTTAGGAPANYIAKWNGSAWSALGSGIMGGIYPNGPHINALAVSGTDLYAGGLFTYAGGVAANHIAKWDGRAWSALGSGIGMDGSVSALAVSGANLYAGGWITTAGGVPANGIAKWDGSAWSALGSGMNYFVIRLAVSGTNLYAGGYFTRAGAVVANYIAKWNGSAWSALGSGMNSHVYALAVSGTNLYAGGWFTTAGGVPANYTAKWDGSAWSALGSGMDVTVQVLTVSGSDLFAGGQFTTAGGVPANYIAKWDGSAWSALGSGMNSFVNALAVSETNFYAGGGFTKAGGVPANYVVKWDGSAWSALGSGVNDFVNALAVDGAGHLFVGGGFTLAGTNVSPYIAEAILVPSVPTILIPPRTQTAEAGATVHLTVDAAGDPPPAYQWYFDGTNALSCTTSNLVLTNILFSQSGTYTVVVTNVYGAVTSAPVVVNVVPPVERRPAAGVKLMGEAGSLLNVDYANSLSATANWLALDTVTLASTSQYCFDVSQPLPPQRFYRAWQTGTPSLIPPLDLHLVPAITLTGSVGGSVRLDYINQFGPIDAWVTLDTVMLTNTSQLYFDTSSIGQPARLWRIVPVP